MDFLLFRKLAVLRHQNTEAVFCGKLQRLIERVIHVRENHGKVDQPIVQFIHQVLRVTAGDMKADVRMLLEKPRCGTGQIMERDRFPRANPHGTGNVVFDLRDFLLDN